MSEDQNLQNPDELVPCPRSFKHTTERIEIGRAVEKIHRVPRRELLENQGICRTCLEELRHHHVAMQHGRLEKPLGTDSLPHNNGREVGAYFGEADDRRLEPFVEFDYGAVDHLLGSAEECSESARHQAAELLAQVFAWCWNDRQAGRPALARYQTALNKFCALCAVMRPDLVDAKYHEIADSLGSTKQLISRYATKFSEQFGGLKFRRARSAAARENMRRAAVGHPATNRKRRKTDGSSLTQ